MSVSPCLRAPANASEISYVAMSVEPSEMVYMCIAIEVDGVLERKIHKLEVPALDSLAFWAADSPFSRSPVLNSDGGSFAVSAWAYTGPLLSSTLAVSDTKINLDTP